MCVPQIAQEPLSAQEEGKRSLSSARQRQTLENEIQKLDHQLLVASGTSNTGAVASAHFTEPAGASHNPLKCYMKPVQLVMLSTRW